MLPKELINDRGLRCHDCNAKIPKGEPMLYFAKDCWNNQIKHGQLCQKCTLKLFYKVCGKKYLTRKAVAHIVSEEV